MNKEIEFVLACMYVFSFCGCQGMFYFDPSRSSLPREVLHSPNSSREKAIPSKVLVMITASPTDFGDPPDVGAFPFHEEFWGNNAVSGI